MFDQSGLHPFDGKFCSATGSLVMFHQHLNYQGKIFPALGWFFCLRNLPIRSEQFHVFFCKIPKMFLGTRKMHFSQLRRKIFAESPKIFRSQRKNFSLVVENICNFIFFLNFCFLPKRFSGQIVCRFDNPAVSFSFKIRKLFAQSQQNFKKSILFPIFCRKMYLRTCRMHFGIFPTKSVGWKPK